MSKKDLISKEIDELLDELRFWRNVLFALLSALIGIIFSYSQHKIEVNFLTESLLISGIIVIFGILFKIYKIKTQKNELHLKLEKEE